jgi:hypothetical protein
MSSKRGEWRLLWALIALVGACSSSARTPTDAAALPDSASDMSSDATMTVPEQLCTQVCQAILQIPCPGEPFTDQDSCVSMCVGFTDCVAQTIAYDMCIVTGGPAILMCDQVGPLVVVKSGNCLNEINNLTDCLGAL